MTDKLFKRSKIICDKINKANCLEANELLEVEMAMRTSDFYEQILNEAIAFDMDNDIGEIKYSTERNYWKKYNKVICEKNS